MRFENRLHAAALLAERLDGYRRARPVVLAIPRGAVPMAVHLAETLGGDADVILVHKLRAPGHPELAIGSIDETGRSYIDPIAAELGVRPDEIQAEIRQQLRSLHDRRAAWALGQPVAVANRVTIVVDDGIATGWTMIAALRAVRARGAGRLVAAVPVAPPEAVARLEAEADELVCLHAAHDFVAVGQFYRDFAEVSDADVTALLAAATAGSARPEG